MQQELPDVLDPHELSLIDRYWRAANYLSVGQIYLMDNPLLRQPLKPEHVKPRLLGHWGTTPGLNFIYAHLNRCIKARNLDMIYVCGPGHGGPGMVANTYLEGSYSEIYPAISRDESGMRNLFRQFSFPGGIPSHAAPETPGSIHEGGELGYALVHAYGAAFDNPELTVACVVGDGEAETGRSLRRAIYSTASLVALSVAMTWNPDVAQAISVTGGSTVAVPGRLYPAVTYTTTTALGPGTGISATINSTISAKDVMQRRSQRFSAQEMV